MEKKQTQNSKSKGHPEQIKTSQIKPNGANRDTNDKSNHTIMNASKSGKTNIKTI